MNLFLCISMAMRSVESFVLLLDVVGRAECRPNIVAASRGWSPFCLFHCVFLCLCACFAERCKQAVGGRLQAQYSSRESGVEALVAAPQVVRRHTLNHKQLVVDAQYAVSLFATLLWQILHQ